jgi:phosphonate transport system permease protein
MNMQSVRREPKPSLVPPSAAAVLSLIVPGLGQMLARRVWRGLLVLGSVVSIIVLTAWRVYDLAHREETVFATFTKALGRRPIFVGLVLVGIVALWLLNAWDAYREAHPGQRGGFDVFILVAVLFFVLGWQISEIDPVKAVRELPEAWPPLSRVLWPWEAAFEREKETIEAKADVLAPCDDQPPPQPPIESEGQPYVMVDPTCGNLSEVEEPGSTITMTGWGFAPNTETEIWWEDPIGNEFRLRQEGEYVSVMTDDEGKFEIDIIMPYRLIPPSAEGRMFHEVKARQVSALGALRASEPLRLTVARMVETIFLGMMATIFGILFSIPVSFLAARNLMSGSWILVVIYYIVRTILNVIRSIEPLIWALVAVVWVGLGPFAGIIALTVHSIAALGKLYSEAIEGIDPGPIEAIQATGATGLQTIVFAVIPQMIPPFVSFSIYRWDINVRMSTVIGLVGGGGIGFLLIQYVRLLNYRAAGIAVWFIAITVAILDYVSAAIRQRFV